MTLEPPKKITVTLEETPADEIQKRDDVQFQTEIDQLIRESEDMRLSYMGKHRSRNLMSIVIGLISIILGAVAFGWFFLMNGQLFMGLGAVFLSFVPSALLGVWTARPPKLYKRAYKQMFLPKLARTLGGLRYFETRGISEKITRRTGILPGYNRYEAEDCFMGKYKGVKVMLSEARLYRDKQKASVFDGVFVLLEVPTEIFEGHTIITADIDRASKWQATRWSKLSPVQLNLENAQNNRFRVYSDAPETASLMIGERLLKELGEAADVFNRSLLSAALFKGKYIFLSIPYDGDMFEASDIGVPVATKQHALHTKHEIDRILEIIDVFELYNTGGNIKI